MTAEKQQTQTVKAGKCLHMHHEATVNVIRLQEKNKTRPHGYCAEVQIVCSDCGNRFYFEGLQGGIFQGKPSVSFRGDKARLPITDIPFHPMDTGGGVPPFLSPSSHDN